MHIKNKSFALMSITILAMGVFILFYSNRYDATTIKDHVPRVKSTEEVYLETYPRFVLQSLWESYSSKIQNDGRTIDRDRNYLTTSEGQSYSLLRAVWMDDQETFERVLKWTNNNLRKRKDDKLFAWKWGQSADGKWDVLISEGGMNTASDADIDIALSLIFAYERWGNESYKEQAIELLNEIWRVEVVMIKDIPVLVAGNWAYEEPIPTINPSYFNFAAFEIFKKYDPENDWEGLKTSSYKILFETSDNKSKLPPDWVSISRVDGKILPVTHQDKTSYYSDDAIRVYWRVALDWIYNKDPRALEYIENHIAFLIEEYRVNKKIYASYDFNGNKMVDYESNSHYGAILPAIAIKNPTLAKQILIDEISVLYDVDLEEFKEDKNIGYYDQNWVWFGFGLYNGMLPNLSN